MIKENKIKDFFVILIKKNQRGMSRKIIKNAFVNLFKGVKSLEIFSAGLFRFSRPKFECVTV